MIRQKVRERLTVWETLLEMGTECQARLTVIPAQMEKADMSSHRVGKKLMMQFSSLALQHRSDWAPKEYSTWTDLVSDNCL